MDAINKLMANITVRRWKVLALIAAVALLAYSPIFQNDFITSYDDGDFFIRWEEVKDLGNLPLLLSGNLPLKHNHVYRPLRSVMQAVMYQMSSIHPFAYHLFALIVHIACIYLVYCITAALHDKHTGLVAALFFAVLPIHVESITFITASFDTAGILFILLSFYLYVLYRTNNQRRFIVWSFILAFISFFTYEIALILPLLFILYEIVIRKTPKTGLLILLGKRLVPFLAAEGLFLFIKYAIVGQRYFGTFFQHLPLSLRLMNGAKSLIHYFYLVIINYPLVVIHKIRISTSFADIAVIATVIGIVVYLDFAWYLFKRNQRIYTFIMLWFLLSLLPVSNIVPISSWVAERYLYLASMSWAVLIAVVFTEVLASPKAVKETRLITVAVCVSLFFGYAGITWARNNDWRDDITFWTSAQKYLPDHTDIYVNLAYYYAQERKDYKTAMPLLKKALEIDPNNALAFGNVGLVLMEQEQYNKAIVAFDKALETETNNAAFYLNRGFSYHSLGKTEEALKDYQEAIRIYPNFYRANFNLAVLYMELKQYDNAITRFERSLKINSKDHESYYGLAEAYAQKGDRVKAFDYIEKSLRFNPSFAPAIELKNRL